MRTVVREPVYLTRAELAEAMRVSERTITRWQAERMPHQRWGRRLVRFRLDQVEAWLKRRAA